MPIGKRPALAVLSFALFFPVARSSAATVTYSTFSTWNANVTGAVELDFGLVNPTGVSYSTAAGITLKPVSGPAYPFLFTGPYSGGYQLTGGTYTTRGISSLYGPTGGQGSITIALPTGGENAILLGLGSTGSASNIVVTLSDGQIFNIAAAPNLTEFFGLSISHNVAWLSVATTTTPVIDDFYFGKSKLTQVAPAAEGSTWTLLGGGLLSLLGFRRKLNLARFAA